MPFSPGAVSFYFTLPVNASAADLARVFAGSATVRDDGRTHRGIDAIRDWRIDTMARTPFTTRPLSIQEQEGVVIVPAEVTGAFPGSPLVLNHRFTLREERIVALEIA